MNKNINTKNEDKVLFYIEYKSKMNDYGIDRHYLLSMKPSEDQLFEFYKWFSDSELNGLHGHIATYDGINHKINLCDGFTEERFSTLYDFKVLPVTYDEAEKIGIYHKHALMQIDDGFDVEYISNIRSRMYSI